MTLTELENLVRTGQLTRERPRASEIDALQRSGEARLGDSANRQLALALAALRRLGYRSERRYVVFQVLPHTLGVERAQWRVLAKAHDVRNLAEYDGEAEIDDRLVGDVIASAVVVRDALRRATGYSVGSNE